jgi:hypothetical protein
MSIKQPFEKLAEEHSGTAMRARTLPSPPISFGN